MARQEIRYRRNRPPSPRLQYGRKVIEDGRGFISYEDRLVENLDGRMVDPRFGGLDHPFNLDDANDNGRP